MQRRSLWRIGVLAAAIAAFVAAAMAGADGPARQATLPENTPFTDAPATESAAIAALIERAGSALAAGRSPSDLLTDPALLPAHEHPRFRKLIREKAQAAPLTFVTPAEPGDRLVIRGVVRTAGGAAAPDVLVYVYQTSAKGLYSDRAAHFSSGDGDPGHARLFGYLRTDRSGAYEIRTIRPASYPRSDLPAHVHVQLEPPQGGSPLITEIVFAADPLLTAPRRREAEQVGFAICTPKRGPDGTLAAVADFKLR